LVSYLPARGGKLVNLFLRCSDQGRKSADEGDGDGKGELRVAADVAVADWEWISGSISDPIETGSNPDPHPDPKPFCIAINAKPTLVIEYFC
jgi:hypothetical protein